MMRNRGSLTIFSALTLMLVASFLLSLLEAAHAAEMKKVTRMDAEVRIESLFAGYQKEVWGSWNLLVLDGTCRSGKMDLPNLEAQILKRKKQDTEHLNLVELSMMDCEAESYTLLTDHNGKVYEALAASYMREMVSYEAAQKLFDEYQAVQTLDGGSKQAVRQALDILEDPSSAGLETTEEESGGATEEQDEVASADLEDARKKLRGNPLAVADELITSGILSLVVKDPSGLSQKSLKLSETVSHRTLETGKNPKALDENRYDKILFEQYLSSRFGSYRNPAKEHALTYEKEYLLFGKSKDQKNLEAAVLWLMEIREGANFLYLVSDPEKSKEALAVAAILAGASANPVVIEAVRYGILAAWAYVESLLDVRALLDGDAVPLMKSYATWTSDLFWLAGSLQSFSKAKSSENGVRYERYLDLMMLFPGDAKLSRRAMDLQEKELRRMPGCENFQMDHMIVSMKMYFRYRFPTVFWSVSPLAPQKIKYLYQSQSVEYSYWKAGA